MQKMNKKGIAEPIVDIFMFFAVILLFVIFGAVFSFMNSQHTFELKEQKGEVDVQAELLQLLRTPVKVKGYETDYAGYIALAHENNDLQGDLKDDLHALITRFIDNSQYSSAKFEMVKLPMTVSVGGMVGDMGSDANMGSIDSSEISVVHIEIPGPDGEKIPVTLKLK